MRDPQERQKELCQGAGQPDRAPLCAALSQAEAGWGECRRKASLGPCLAELMSQCTKPVAAWMGCRELHCVWEITGGRLEEVTGAGRAWAILRGWLGSGALVRKTSEKNT